MLTSSSFSITLPGAIPLANVLLVEDNPADLRLFAELMRDTSRSAREVTTVEVTCLDRLATACEYLSTHPIDLVLLDLSLPDSSGLETLARLRSAAPAVPVIVLTGLDDDEIGIDAIRAGAQDYIVKGEATTPLLVRALRYAAARRELHAALERLALVDELTGLYNRRAFTMLAEEQLCLARRMGHAVLLFAIDLDGLKAINDSYGHPIGDEAIRAAAAVLQDSFRKSDVVARVGGDEFVVLAIGVAPEADHVLRARLQEHCARHRMALPACPYNLAMSVGTVRIEADDDTTLADIWSDADVRLYDNKRARKAPRMAETAALGELKNTR